MTARTRFRRKTSVFFVSAVAIVACILAVGAALSWQSLQQKSDLVRDAMRTRALEVTHLISTQSGGAIQFGRESALVALFQNSLNASDGSALGALAYSTAQGSVAEAGTVSRELMRLAESAATTGDVALSSEAYLVAIPVLFGEQNAVVGAVAMEWSPETILADVRKVAGRSLVFALMVLVASTAAATLFLRRHLSRPLLRLTQATRAISGGDFDVEIPAVRRGDEIGAIAQELSTFRDRFREAEHQRRESAFKSAAVEGTTAPMLMLSKAFEVVYLNDVQRAIIRDLAPEIRKSVPEFDPAKVEGESLSIFHGGNVSFDELLDPENLPRTFSMYIGKAFVRVHVASVWDGDEVIGYVAEMADVTERTLTRAVLNSIEAAQLTAQFAPDGALTEANALFAETMGASDLGSLRGKTIGELFDVSGLGYETTGALSEALTSGTPAFGKVRARARDAVLEGSLSGVLDSNGAPMAFVLIAKDVTRSEREVAEAERLREEMERSQSEVVDALSVALKSVSSGNLTARIEMRFADRYEALRSDFNSAIEGLCNVVGSVSEMSANVRKEAVEIASSADSLSSRTERTAATLEQTAAALDQLTSSVSSAAEGAERADTVVSDARTHATQSGEVVREAVEAMSEIEGSAGKIAKIIDVIEDIAFQTNLLALNAGVEAARAGEAGRGFAVVASEVRALAQRSSDAAREINDLITSSGVQVQRGVQLVDRAGKALEQIVSSVGEIADLVAGIAVSSKEQSTGVSEINTAVNQLDQATQQNAAMFEETTAASHALTQVAESLNETVARFDTGAPRARAAAGPAARISSDRVRAPSPSADTAATSIPSADPAAASSQASARAPSRASTTQTPSTHASGGSAALSTAVEARKTVPDDDDGWEEF
ncbi:MAG: methyl-accepting chemotaxis protein [Pseudomonadota bacterium]